jgi:hypothetical protein
MRKFKGARMFLVCSKCGRETPGLVVERPGVH